MNAEELGYAVQQWLIDSRQITASCPNECDLGMVIIWRHGNVAEQLGEFIKRTLREAIT